MKSIIQIHNLSKNELVSIIENSLDERFNSFIESKKDLNLTVQETAKYLSVSELTIYNYIKKGLIPACKIGRKIVIKKQDVDQSLSQVKSLKYKRDV